MADLPGHRLGTVEIDIGHRRLNSFQCQQPDDRPTDPRRATCDDGALTAKH